MEIDAWEIIGIIFLYFVLALVFKAIFIYCIIKIVGGAIKHAKDDIGVAIRGKPGRNKSNGVEAKDSDPDI